MVFAERLDQQEVDGEPDRPTPIRISTELPRVHVARNVRDLVLEVTAVRAEDVRAILVHARQRPDAMRRQELALVEQVTQRALQPLSAGQRQEPAAVRLDALDLDFG